MGGAQSSAESVVNQIFDAAFSITDTAIGSASPQATDEQVVEISDCDIIHIPGGIDMKQMARMNMSSVASNLSKPDMDIDIESSIKQALESSAEAGLGWAESHVEFVDNLSMRVAAAVVTEAKSLADGLVSQVQKVAITGCKELDIAFIKMEQIDDIKAKAFSKNESTTHLKAQLVQELDQQGISKAKGFDPTWIILAIVAVIVIFIFGGFDVVAMNVVKPSVWFLVSLAVAAWGVWDLVKGFTHNEILPDDKPDVVEKKERWHAKDKKWGWIFAGVGGVAALLTGFIFMRSTRKK